MACHTVRTDRKTLSGAFYGVFRAFYGVLVILHKTLENRGFLDVLKGLGRSIFCGSGKRSENLSAFYTNIFMTLCNMHIKADFTCLYCYFMIL